LGYPGSGGWVGRIMFVLRTFPELEGRSVENLVEIGPADRVKRVHRPPHQLREGSFPTQPPDPGVPQTPKP